MLASVRQDQLGALRVGQPARVSINGLGDARFDGKITSVGQALDPATRTMSVRIALKNSNGVLRGGMLGAAEIPVGQGRTTVVVPSDALQQVNGENVVFVQTAPDKFAVRHVEAGQASDGQVPIGNGLKAGESIVVRGSFVLKSQLLRASLAEGD